MHSPFYRFTLIAIMILAVDFLRGADFLPPVTNFDDQLGNFGQIYSCAQDCDGIMYFGANGVISYDGYRWQLHHVPGNYIVRSVFAYDGKIYVGSYEEFGYFERNEFGQLVYTSLSKGLCIEKLYDCEIWNIVAAYGKVWFKSFHKLFSYDGIMLREHVYPNMNLQRIYECQGELYCQFYEHGLFRIDSEGKAHRLLSSSMLHGDEVMSLLNIGHDSFLLAFGNSGLMTYVKSKSSLERLNTRYGGEFMANQITHTIITKDSLLVVSTHRKGVFALTLDGKLLWHYERANGLINDAVISMFEDNSGNIWIPTDCGLSLIQNRAPYTVLRQKTGEPYLGDVNDIAEFAGKLYLATSQGFFCYDKITGRLELCPWESGYMWHATNIGGVMFTGSNEYTNQLSDDGRVNSKRASTSIIEREDAGGLLIESSFDGLSVYKPTSRKNSYVWLGPVSGLRNSLRHVEQDFDGALWCAHMASGVIRVILSEDGTQALNVKHFRSLASEDNPSLCYVLKINGMVVISDGDSLFSYDRNQRVLQSFEALNRDLPHLKGVNSTTDIGNGTFWLSTNRGYSKVKFDGDHYHELMLIPLGKDAGTRGSSNGKVFIDSDGITYFTLNNSIGRLRNDLENGAHIPQFIPVSVNYINADGDDVVLPINTASTPAVDGNINIKFTFPNYNALPCKFLYILEGGEHPQYEISTVPEKSYAGLKQGDYTFSASYLGGNGEQQHCYEYKFSVPTPFYMSAWFILLCVLTVVSATFVITRYLLHRAEQRRLEKQQQEKNAIELKVLEQRRIIDEQQRQLLEQQLEDKTKELTNIAIDNVSRNVIISDLRKVLESQKKLELSESQSVDIMLRKIDSGVGDKEFWEIFQHNFDLIHQNYFANLRKKYPSLTSVDLRFCALLRFNMSTKDIVQFTNLSVRGVESARYRLRKKLGLKGDASLVQFLIDFSFTGIQDDEEIKDASND